MLHGTKAENPIQLELVLGHAYVSLGQIAKGGPILEQGNFIKINN